MKSPTHSANTKGDSDPFQRDTREDCEVRQILDRTADKWSLLAIALLDERILPFTELRRKIDRISQRMLTVTPRQLERDGLLRRTVYPSCLPELSTKLTPLGATLHDTIQSLVTWTEEHQTEIAAASAPTTTPAPPPRKNSPPAAVAVLADPTHDRDDLLNRRLVG